MFESLSQYISISWVYYSLFIVYVLTVIGIIFVVISENRNPVKSLAWVTVLLMLPAVGIILYLFFGRSIKNKHIISRRNRRRLKKKETSKSVPLKSIEASELTRQSAILSKTISGYSLHAGNNIRVYTQGATKFTDLINDLKNARESIYVQYYIFADDELGRAVADLLIAKAKVGVDVRVIYDHVGSIKTRNLFFRRMSHNGVKIHPFFKVSFPSLGTRINWRNHRKIVVIDDTIGYIGGMNIATRYIDGGKAFRGWRDTHLRVEGPIAQSLSAAFNVDWNFMGYELPPDRKYRMRRKEKTSGHVAPILNSYAPETVEVGDIAAQLITSGPTQQWSNISLLFHKIISGATKRIYIQTPYFLPTEGLLKSLQAAALSHVEVRVMLPEKSDSLMLTYASSSYVTECLRAGVKIYFYQPGMLHSKMFIVDDEISSVGSANFDFRSFEHNFEANLMMFSKELNQKLTEMFLKDQDNCRRVVYSEWRERSKGRRMAESLLRLLSPIL